MKKSWNGYLLDTAYTVVSRAENFYWKGMRTVVRLVDTVYEKGIKICRREKKGLEQRLSPKTAYPAYPGNSRSSTRIMASK